MWPRITELLIALWLIVSHYLFGYEGAIDIIAALLIVLCVMLSFYRKLSKMHLLEIIPVGLLFYVSYTYPTYTLPFSLQNFIVTGMTLLFFCILPTAVHDSPTAWKDYLSRSKEK